MNVYTDGSVLLSHGGVEMGQGLHTKMIQVGTGVTGRSRDGSGTPYQDDKVGIGVTRRSRINRLHLLRL